MFDPRRIVLAVVALLTLLAVVPQVAAAKGPVHFHATTNETVVVVPCAPNFCISITGPGQATQLGKITESAQWLQDLVNLPPSSIVNCWFDYGTMTLTGADGDSISLYLHGMHCLTSPTRGQGSSFYIVTGGTGRFKGATGVGTETIDVDLTDFAHPISRPVFDGTLSVPGDK